MIKNKFIMDIFYVFYILTNLTKMVNYLIVSYYLRLYLIFKTIFILYVLIVLIPNLCFFLTMLIKILFSNLFKIKVMLNNISLIKLNNDLMKIILVLFWLNKKLLSVSINPIMLLLCFFIKLKIQILLLNVKI